MKRYLTAIVLSALAMILSVSISRAGELCQQAVSTTDGLVIGMNDNEACAYKGIPYAAAPVGDLRWRPPQPPAKHERVFTADTFGPECTQIEMYPSYLMMGKKPNRSEDCLYLNIWRPRKSGTFPVMFWIHGGSLTSGTGSDPMYFGDRLAAGKDVVVVTFNYRLAALGFLAHRGLSAEDPRGSSGNYGMLDQVAAMKWVKENIANFGGDPGNVTIFGESAGGWSVCMHLASPLSAGLFQKAILESGGCNITQTMEQGFANGEEIAGLLGCTGPDAVSCLRSKPAQQVIDARTTSEPPTGHGFELTLKDLEMVWVPLEDGWFLNEAPMKSLLSGNYNQVPFLVGSNLNESKLFAAADKVNYRWIGKSKVVEAIDHDLGPDGARTFTRLYPYKNYDRPIEAMVDAKGDITLSCKCFEAAEAIEASQPVYYYRFDYHQHRAPHVLGAAHAFELPYIFDSLDRGAMSLLYSKSQREKARPLVEQMMSYWTNFAKSGNPNGPGLVSWPAYDLRNRNRMLLDLPVRVAPVDNVEKCEFWNARGPDLKL